MIGEDLESDKKRTRTRKVDLYDVFCAVLYLFNKVKYNEECLSSGFLNWKLVYYYFTI